MGEVIDFPGKPHEKAKMPERGQLVVVTWVDACENSKATDPSDVGLAVVMTPGFFYDVDKSMLRIVTSACKAADGVDANGAFAFPVGTVVSVTPFDCKAPMP